MLGILFFIFASCESLMVDPTDKDTKYVKEQSTGRPTEGYLEYTKEEEKGKVNQVASGEQKGLTQYV